MGFTQISKHIARGIGATALVVTLAACVDIGMEIEVLDAQNARGTMTMAMDRQFYDMSQAQGGEEFCGPDDELTVTETTAICISSEEGAFADVIDAQEGEPAPTFTDMGDGTIKVTMPTGEIMADMSSEAPDAETLAMMASMFEGKMFSLTVSGNEIVDTNMVLAEDGKSASFSVPVLDLITGEAESPTESYAIVKFD